jgi:DEAD/DEAH box helicase domain-containing protein
MSKNKSNKPTDYAAIIKAVNIPKKELPHWVETGNQVVSEKHGPGEILQVLGDRCFIKFKAFPLNLMIDIDQLTPIISEKEISEKPSNYNSDIIAIKSIPQRQFRAIAEELSANINHLHIEPPTEGEIYPIPEQLPQGLKTALNTIGITYFYGHQIEAFNELQTGKDLMIVTPTASGKTLCYNPAILSSCLEHQDTTALYLFPLKALALDQIHKLEQLVTALPPDQRVKIGQMDGDTPSEQRQKLFALNPPQILALTPDLLHHQLYQIRKAETGETWRKFLRNLRWIVIDESHTYIGAFGAHFANLMRRLKRAIDKVGGNSEQLQFIFASATIGNPEEMALRFSGRNSERLHLISKSGSDNAGRTIIFIRPSETYNIDTCKIIFTWLERNLSGIVFCNNRSGVKNILTLLQKQAERDGIRNINQKVAIFYGSLKGHHRREVINKIRSGEIKIILSTSALEAGIDLPELDCCLIRGYPGSIMSFRQRIGRAGRKNPGLIIFLPISRNPIDYYYGTYPKQLLSEPSEKAAFNPDYPTILSKHLECSCVESGLPIGEITQTFGHSGGAIANILLKQEKLFISAQETLLGRGYPHKLVNFRGTGFNKIKLIDKDSGEDFEEMPAEIAYREVFPGAIYQGTDTNGHLISYQCETLDLERKQAILKTFSNEKPELFTQSESDLKIDFQQDLNEHQIIETTYKEGRLRLRLGWGEITDSVTGYQLSRRDEKLTCNNRNCKNHHLPANGKFCRECQSKLKYREITKVIKNEQFATPYQVKYQAPILKMQANQGLINGIMWEVEQIKAKLRKEYGEDIPEDLISIWKADPTLIALHSITHQIQFAIPLVVLSSSNDINCVVEKTNQHIFAYFFDSCDGGNGAAEAIFQDLPKFATKAKYLAETCDCDYGCPRCLMNHGCPQKNAELNKLLGLSLLSSIIK